jgi:HAD superfamily hydrolase (TIGR01509 family)
VIRALICDLDDTLYPSGSIPVSVVQPVFDAMVAANQGPGAMDASTLERALAAAWRHPFDQVAAQFGLPRQLQRVWSRANASLHLTDRLAPYPDVDVLRRLALRRYLVTTGYERFQRSKVVALGMESDFEAVYVDALDIPHRRPGKQRLFQLILTTHAFAPSEVAVVGDGPSEIRAGNALGLATIQILREGVTKLSEAQYHIADFIELPEVLRRHGAAPA